MLARLLALVAVTALAAPAVAKARALPATRATLDLPDGWAEVTGRTGGALIAAYQTRAGAALAITRAPVPNPDAWRTKTRAAYIDQIERGLAAATPGYRRLQRTVSEVAGVPTLDLEARRADGTQLVIRILLFRTYALALAIELPRGAELAPARAIAHSLAPPPA